jgi:sigma-B regulation protein RsbU (phosphoserine phosphatase)
LCNAGHCPPLVVRADTVAELPASGPPIGLFDGRSYVPAEVRLDPGDVLFLHTDGVTEASNPVGEEYGADKLRARLRAARGQGARAMAAACFDDVARFRAGAPRADDVTLLVLQRLG